MLLPCQGILKICLIDADRTYRVMTCLQKPGSSLEEFQQAMKRRYTSLVVVGFSLDNPQDISLPPWMQIIGIEIQLHQWLYFGGCVGHQANHNIIRHPPSCHSSYAPIVIDNYGATILLAFQWAVVSKTTGGARTTERLVCRKAKSSYLHSSLQVILCHPIDIEEYSSTCCCSYTDFACISNMFYACISDKCGIEVSC